MDYFVSPPLDSRMTENLCHYCCLLQVIRKLLQYPSPIWNDFEGSPSLVEGLAVEICRQIYLRRWNILGMEWKDALAWVCLKKVLSVLYNVWCYFAQKFSMSAIKHFATDRGKQIDTLDSCWSCKLEQVLTWWHITGWFWCTFGFYGWIFGNYWVTKIIFQNFWAAFQTCRNFGRWLNFVLEWGILKMRLSIMSRKYFVFQ